MSSLLGKSFEIFAYAANQFARGDTKTDYIIALGSVPLSDDDGSIRIDIAAADPITARQRMYQQNVGISDHKTAICFRLRVTRSLVSRYLRKIEDKHPNLKRLSAAPPESKKMLRETRGVVFIGMIVRALRSKVYKLIMIANLANFKCFPVCELSYFQLGRRSVLDQIAVRWSNRPCYANLFDLDTLVLTDLLNYFERMPDFNSGIPKTPLMRALACYSYVYSGGGRSTIMGLFWSLASIETLLNPRGRSVRSQIEDKLKVIFAGTNEAEIVSRFKNLYNYRSDVMHGALSLPMYLEEGQYGSQDMPLEHMEFALALSCKLIQICFERNVQVITFQLSIT